MTRRVGRVASAGIATLLVAGGAVGASAQLPFDGKSGWQLAPVAQSWSFGCCSRSAADSSLQSASQVTIPFAAALALGRRVLLDAYIAYVFGEASTRGSSSVPATHVRVDGLTDLTLRGSVRLHGDDMLITAAVNVPTGLTNLDSSQFLAMEVLGAPVVQAQSPVLGSGFGATVGLVGARKFGDWSWGAGASYQYRTEYTPMQAAALGLGPSVSNVKLAPGGAVRLSIGADGLVGTGAMAFSVAVTLYAQEQFTRTLAVGPPAATQLTLGPTVQGEWRWRTTAQAFHELNVFAYDRYVSRYTIAGESPQPGTNGNFLYFGVSGISPLSAGFGMVTQLHGRWLTGLTVDNTLATAATLVGGAGLGVSWMTGGTTLTPMISAEFGTIDSGLQRFRVSELQLSLALASH